MLIIVTTTALCIKDKAFADKYFIPQDPSAMVRGGQIVSDVRDISDLSIVRAIPEAFDSKPETNTKAPIVEANAWIINEEGNVELVAVVNSNQALDFLRATCAIKED
ncbi:hypothetical protein [Moorena sp. SIO3H5]|uniref:hypothetical protein n=1 Tax=Moorena sp. SIO3H5 TaxID=2607834 RepID=UPI0013BB4098|nr:hypothetical protein [Moorena sp. SIO3H5]NEO68325.1 hypothetical protein [Moorena sp. SIO3H5]